MNKLEFRMDIPAVTREYTPGSGRNSRKPRRLSPTCEMRPDSPALCPEQLRFPNQTRKEPRFAWLNSRESPTTLSQDEKNTDITPGMKIARVPKIKLRWGQFPLHWLHNHPTIHQHSYTHTHKHTHSHTRAHTESEFHLLQEAPPEPLPPLTRGDSFSSAFGLLQHYWVLCWYPIMNSDFLLFILCVWSLFLHGDIISLKTKITF